MSRDRKGNNIVHASFEALGGVLKFMRPWTFPYIVGLVVWASQNFVGNFTFSVFYKLIVAAVAEGGAMADALRAVGVYIGIEIVYMLIFCSGCYLFFHTKKRWQLSMENTLLSRLLGAVSASHTGEDITLLVSDSDNAMNAATSQLGHILMAIFPLIGGSIMIIAVDVRLWLISIAGGIIFMLTDVFFARPVREAGERVQEGASRANRELTGTISGALTVRLFSLAGARSERYAAILEGIRRQGMRLTKIKCGQTAINTLRGFIIQAGVLGVGCIFVARGEYKLSDLMMLQPMIGQLMYNFTLIVNAFVWMQPGVASARRINGALARPQEDSREDGQTARPEDSSRDVALELSGVTFHYPGREEPALDDVSFKVARGEVVALVGGSGSGKTTIFRLLLGMLNPDGGAVYQWGVDSKQAALEPWRANIAYVAQDAPLFDGTLRENIAFGRLGASEGDILAAARAANAEGFIMDMPEGMDTPAGLLGGRISGGQRQRVAIARAFVRDAPVLLLDEATSSLDAESEREVQAAINDLMVGRTVLVCAHRLNTIMGADRIIVLEGGRVVECGRHEELISLGGVYAAAVAAGGRKAPLARLAPENLFQVRGGTGDGA